MSGEKTFAEKGPSHSEPPSTTATLDERPITSSHELHNIVDEQIVDLARTLTSQSQGQPGSLFPAPDDGPLDPNSPRFDARKWARAFYNLRSDLTGGSKPKTTGIAFQNLDVYGFGSSTDFQKSVGNVWLGVGTVARKLLGQKQQRVDILRNLEGVVRSGEMLAVLGPPGSGCSTFLKTVAGDTHGFHVGDRAVVNYQGIRPGEMSTAFRGEAIYTAEVDDHFPHLTAGDTLYFAARARCPNTIPEGVSRREYAEHLRDVTMAMFGISHTKNTRVGDDYVRGVSGGERKRVTIAEAALSYSPLQCWDNSTRGLDSANALEFCRTLRTQADVMGTTACVAIYQASQDAYDVFDKVIVLYEGRQIFFGKADEARTYFENLGFECPGQQTTADFLTSMTSHQERVIRPGFENKTPRTPDEFAEAWRNSRERAALVVEIEDYERRHPFGGEHYQTFLASRKADQSGLHRSESPYTVSYFEQMKLCLWRAWVLLLGDPSMTATLLATNLFEALIISSIFYNLPDDTSSLFRRGLLVFFIVVMNAFASILELFTLYTKRRIVEKHNRYALYRPSAEALAAMIVDLPYKITNTIIVNSTLYFMTNLRREPGPYFFFLLVSFLMCLSMSMMFRLIGSLSRSVSQALAPSSIVLLATALYGGFAIPPKYMQDWFGWFRWINPVYYVLEALLVNDFNGRKFTCSELVPSGGDYNSVDLSSRVCTTIGAIPGQDFVDGGRHAAMSYGFQYSHRWRNFGITVAFMLFFMCLHLFTSEIIASARSKGEVLVFSRVAMKSRKRAGAALDVESGSSPRAQLEHTSDSESSGAAASVQKQTSVFHWKDVCYDIKVKGEGRRILDHVDGWVKPGTLTALMGVSGAGKTTLLDVLASRVTMGIITGEMLVDGQPRDSSFQRKTGYVTQQDLHLHTSTVREALSFSAVLRQPARYSHRERLDYVDTVIDLLGMQEYSDAVIGVPGEGLNVEQRKRLTIGVELAARPELLLFLDEPTSGLDSQTSWSVCDLMEKLTKSGQAILCTIHQPSAMLFQRFDRLLLLARGGKTVYFGDVGKNSAVLTDYFTRNGAAPLKPGANPAEYMLEVIGAAPGATTDIDWPSVWRASPEYTAVQEELSRLGSTKVQTRTPEGAPEPAHAEFAAPFSTQLAQVTTRVFQQYWRSPAYIYSKATLSFGAALFIGLSFLNASNTQRGLQNQMFGVFIFLTIFSQMVEQIMPVFVSQRTLYEARERPAKTYAWQAFLAANIAVELVWNSAMAAICFVCWYYPIGLYRNAEHTGAVHERGATMFALVWAFFMFMSTFANMLIAGIADAEVAGGILNLLMILMFSFNGILATPEQLPGFWIFMYRVNPFTYVVESFLGNALANAPVHCASEELLSFAPPDNSTCESYMSPYIEATGGYLDASSTASECLYCPISSTNSFLASRNMSFDNRWRDFGIIFAFVVFNAIAAVGLYWLARVPKGKKVKKE